MPGPQSSPGPHSGPPPPHHPAAHQPPPEMKHEEDKEVAAILATLEEKRKTLKSHDSALLLSLQTAGDTLFKRSRYEEAVPFYTELIDTKLAQGYEAYSEANIDVSFNNLKKCLDKVQTRAIKAFCEGDIPAAQRLTQICLRTHTEVNAKRPNKSTPLADLETMSAGLDAFHVSGKGQGKDATQDSKKLALLTAILAFALPLEHDVSQHDDYAPMYDAVHSHRSAILGEAHRETLEAASKCAQAAYKHHAVDRDDASHHMDEKEHAFDVYISLIEKAKQHLGETDEDTLKYIEAFRTSLLEMNVIGQTYFVESRHAKAEIIWRDVYKYKKLLLGPEEESVLVNMSNWAVALVEMGKCDEARKVAEECLALKRKTGASDESLATTQGVITAAEQKQGASGWAAFSPIVITSTGSNSVAIRSPPIEGIFWGIGTILNVALMPLNPQTYNPDFYGNGISKLGQHCMTKNGHGQAAAPAPAPVAGDMTAALNGKKRVAVYFSAHWCPPCRAFTPVLSEFYTVINTHTPDSLEIVFVSKDNSKEEFDRYYRSMPWLALPYGSENITSCNNFFNVQGIPTLVVMSADGRVLDADGRATVAAFETDPAGALAKWAV